MFSRNTPTDLNGSVGGLGVVLGFVRAPAPILQLLMAAPELTLPAADADHRRAVDRTGGRRLHGSRDPVGERLRAVGNGSGSAFRSRPLELQGDASGPGQALLNRGRVVAGDRHRMVTI